MSQYRSCSQVVFENEELQMQTNNTIMYILNENYLTNIKYFPDISTRVEIGKTKNCVETRRAKGGVFSNISSTFEFTV